MPPGRPARGQARANRSPDRPGTACAPRRECRHVSSGKDRACDAAASSGPRHMICQPQLRGTCMKTPKKLLNDPRRATDEMMDGLVLAYDGRVSKVDGHGAFFLKEI